LGELFREKFFSPLTNRAFLAVKPLTGRSQRPVSPDLTANHLAIELSRWYARHETRRQRLL